MNFLRFRNQFFELACFTPDQVYAWQPDFDRNNFYRWLQKGLLVRLRKGLYAFPEYAKKPGYQWYFANRMYRPSYISLFSALAFYGLIPESVVQILSVTSLKTAGFVNPLGEFYYKTVREDLMFGFEPKALPDGKYFQIARPEKALLDLLYLYPEYNSEEQMLQLRLDEDFLKQALDKRLLAEYASFFRSKTLQARILRLLKAYGV